MLRVLNVDDVEKWAVETHPTYTRKLTHEMHREAQHKRDVEGFVEWLKVYQIKLERGDNFPMVYFRLLESDWQYLKQLVSKPLEE